MCRRAMRRSVRAHAISITNLDDEWQAIQSNRNENVSEKNQHLYLWFEGVTSRTKFRDQAYGPYRRIKDEQGNLLLWRKNARWYRASIYSKQGITEKNYPHWRMILCARFHKFDERFQQINAFYRFKWIIHSIQTRVDRIDYNEQCSHISITLRRKNEKHFHYLSNVSIASKWAQLNTSTVFPYHETLPAIQFCYSCDQITQFWMEIDFSCAIDEIVKENGNERIFTRNSSDLY